MAAPATGLQIAATRLQIAAARLQIAAARLQIGGIELEISLPAGLRLCEPDELYRPFHNAPAPVPAVRVPLTLSLDPGPETSHLPLCFETGASWSARADGETVVLELPAPGGGLLWRARLDDPPPRVLVSCGPALLGPAEAGGQVPLLSPVHYPLDQLLLDYLLAPRNGLIVHAAGLAVGGRGLMLCGPSGSGKTTIMRLLSGLWHGPHGIGLSDDRVVVRRIGGQPLVLGTPWAGEGRVRSSSSAALVAIVLLHQSARTELVPLRPPQAVQRLLPTCSVLWYDRRLLAMQTAFLDQLLRQVPAYELHFTRTPAVTELIADLLEPPG